MNRVLKCLSLVCALAAHVAASAASAASATSATSATSAAAPSKPVELARQLGFTGCDALINDVFAMAMQSPHQFNLNALEDPSPGQLVLSVVFGAPDDVAYQTASFTKKNGACFAQQSYVVTRIGECRKLVQTDRIWTITGETVGGGLRLRNAGGGVSSVMVQAGSRCMQVYERNQTLPAAK